MKKIFVLFLLLWGNWVFANSGADDFNKGYEFYKKGIYQEAIKYFKKSCQINNSAACGILGDMYILGKGVQENFNKGIVFLEKSCNLNNSMACYHLSIDCVNNDSQKAFFYAKKACNLNSAKGCMTLALFYKIGLVVNSDFLKYKKYLKKSCNLGFMNACKTLNSLRKEDMLLANVNSNSFDFCNLSQQQLNKYIYLFKDHIKDNDYNLYKAIMHLEVDTLLQRYNRISFIINTKEGYLNKISNAENEAENAIMQGYLPENFTINTSNLLTKKGKINATFNSKNVAVLLMRYLFPANNIKKTVYRNILMEAYLITYLHYITFENVCRNPFDNWEDIFKDAYVFTTDISLKLKNKNAIRMLFLLLNNNFNELDNFLSSNSNVKKLTNYALNLFYKKLKEYKTK